VITVTGRYEKIWAPHPKQVEFIRLPPSVFEALYGGAAGGGKSELLLMLPVLYGFHDIPGFHGVIFRQTFPQLEESLIPRSHGFYKPLGASYNDTKHVWTFPSGAKIRLSYLETEKDAREHDTAEYHYAGFDELTAFLEFVYRYITSRVRSTLDGVPALVRSASNPGNIGHVWVRTRFVAPYPDGGAKLWDPDSKTFRFFVRARLTDNPHLMEKDPGYLDRLRILPEAERRAKIDGDWWVFSGQVFSEWRDPFVGTPYSGEPQRACHVIPDFNPPEWWPRVISADWGYTAKTWVGWGAVAPNGRLFLYREYVREKTSIEEWGADVRRISQFELGNLGAATLDPSAWGKRGENKTLAQQITEATGINWQPADNDRIGGKLLMHEMLRWAERPPRYIPAEGYNEDTAQRIYRMQGPDVYKEYMDLFTPEQPETNLPKLQVCKSLVHFRETIPACIYEQRDGKNTEDVADFDGDDPYDGARYLIKAYDRYIRESSKRHEKATALGDIIQRLETTQDYNAFHRQMYQFEKKFKKPNRSIPRSRFRKLNVLQ
jgi:hypothetical protein